MWVPAFLFSIAGNGVVLTDRQRLAAVLDLIIHRLLSTIISIGAGNGQHILRSHSNRLTVQLCAVPVEDDRLLTSLSVSQARAVQLGVAADSQRRGSNCGEEIRNRSGECAVGDLGRIQSNNASRISLIPQALSHLIRLEVKRVFTGYGRSSGVCVTNPPAA